MKNLVIAPSAVAAALSAPAALAHDHISVPGVQIGVILALTIITVVAFSVPRRRLRKLAARKREDRR
jgi:hypothetical protein